MIRGWVCVMIGSEQGLTWPHDIIILRPKLVHAIFDGCEV